jgi:type IV pilus assembly protein PilE
MRRRQTGVTLIELMTVVVVVGILAAIALPSYRQYGIRANRADAKIALMQAASTLERCYSGSTPFAYNSAACNLLYPAAAFNTAAGTYQINLVRNAQTFTLTAVPLGRQTEDLTCATFGLTETGLQTVTGTASADPAECWRR